MTPARLIPLFCLFLFVPVAQAQKDDPKKKEPMLEGLKALQHPDANVRYKAAHTLAELGPLAKFAVTELREALKDKSGLVRIKAAEALWKVDKTPTTALMPVLMPALKDKDAKVRAAAPPVIALFGAKAKPALPALVTLLEDKNFGVKLSVVVALGDLGPLAKDAAGDLLALSNDREFYVLEPFVGATLASLGSDVVPTLAKALSDESPDRRRLAAYALGSMDDAAPATDALIGALTADDPATRKLAARALGKIRPTATKPLLAKLEKSLVDKEVSVRIEAALTLWLVTAQTKHIGVLTSALTDESPSVREVACQALGTMKAAAKDAVGPVAKLLDDKELRVRAIATLGEIGPAADMALPALRKLIADKDGEASLTSAFAVWQITGQAKESLPVLEKGLGSEVHDRLAMRLLGEMGDAAQSVLPTLVAMYREEEIAVYRQTLAIAIKKIDPKAAMQLGIK